MKLKNIVQTTFCRYFVATAFCAATLGGGTWYMIEESKERVIRVPQKLVELADQDGIPGLSLSEAKDISRRAGMGLGDQEFHKYPPGYQPLKMSIENTERAIKSYEENPTSP